MTCICGSQESLAYIPISYAQWLLDTHWRRECPERKCSCVSCEREATDRGMCAAHSWYFRVLLADPYYRDHPTPGMRPDGAVQLQLREGVKA